MAETAPAFAQSLPTLIAASLATGAGPLLCAVGLGCAAAMALLARGGRIAAG
ncbi:hypothetical protein ABZ318_03380 [Streptomyces sp. NPDC006197]|uniref:hypothetical protein n=1 Tax=Streptomyces sp. NPDC006197 TaxID=3156685 RepID=UPI0033AA83BC